MKSPSPRLRGVLAPVVTPFDSSGEIDRAEFLSHCAWLADSSVGLAVFGTNSEAVSLSLSERMELLEVLGGSGISPNILLPGTGCCNIPDTVELTRAAIKVGAGGVLVLPPFFYKNVSEDGLFAYYSEVIEKVGDSNLALYLYNIPALSGVAISTTLIGRLLKRYPENVRGLKDSSGDRDYLAQVLARFATSGFDVFCASEALLTETIGAAGAGCISATANVNPRGIRSLYEALRNADQSSAALQTSASRIRSIFQAYPLISAMKAVLAETHGKPSWAIVRPPLDALPQADARRLQADLDAIGFRLRDGSR